MTDTARLRVVLAGVTGWTGSALPRGIAGAPDVPGALLAIRRVSRLVGVVRGLDRVLDD